MTAGMEKAAPWLIYPLVMILAFALFALLQRQGASLIVSTYVPVLVTAAAGDAARAEVPAPDRSGGRHGARSRPIWSS